MLDEPLSNLDKKLRVQMRQELLALQRKLGITTIFVTHDQEEAMTTADRLAVMDKGIVQQIGTPTALFDYPINQFVAQFVGTINFLRGVLTQVNGEVVTFAAEGLGEIKLPKCVDTPKAGDIAISFRPHTVSINIADTFRDAANIWLDGHVEQSEFLGEFMRYRVRVGEHRVTADHPHMAGMLPFGIGSRVVLGVQPSQVRFLAS